MSEKGIALLLVLWVLAVLMVIVLSFSYMTRTETHATLNFKEGIQKRFLAEAGIERGIMELFYRNINKGQTVVLEGHEVWKVDGTPYSDQVGSGSYRVAIVDESGKLNINKMTDANAIILKQLLINSGVPEKEVNTIVDSILDWKDPNKGMHRLNGAGDEFYRSLPNPYEAKHADFDTVEELLLVKGMTPEILYGDGENKGVVGYITVNQGNAWRINVNTAPREVLLAVPGVTPETADSIISLRQYKELSDIAELGLPQQTLQQFQQLGLTTAGSNTFSVEAVGYKNDAKTGYSARATVFIEGNNKFRYLSYKSPAKVTSERTQKQEG